MSLATATAEGVPSCRIVLLKHFDHEGFVFFTNLKSTKSSELIANPHAALCFYWAPLNRQIRIDGTATPVSDAEADQYFATRPRTSQIGVWASKQSQHLPDRHLFEERIAQAQQRFEGQPVPRPEHWSGWRILPTRFEFWEQQEFRLHSRWEYILDQSGQWQHQLLYP